MDAFDDWYGFSDEAFEELQERVRTTPPQCFAGLKAKPEAPKETPGGGLAPRWGLACACGNETGAALGHPLSKHDPDDKGPPLYVSPLAFRCSACANVAEIIDTGIHGYDAELTTKPGELNRTSIRGEGERVAVACPGCGGTDYTVTTTCMHSHFDHIEDEPELASRAQDFFDCFSCEGVCGCGERFDIAGFELA